MEFPRVLRCRAAVISRLVAVGLWGLVSVGMVIQLAKQGFDDLVLGTLFALALAFSVPFAVHQAVGLRARVLVQENGLELVGLFNRRLVKWREIQRFEADCNGLFHRLWIIDIRGERLRVDAFAGLISSFHLGIGPPSFREAVAELEDEWRRAS